MAIELQQTIPICYLEQNMLRSKGIRLGILRLDAIHPKVSGNKWFKLKENIREAQACHKTSLLTFGGAYSNHLVATAAAAKAFGLNSIGMVRGLHAREYPSDTLKNCDEEGMTLHYLDRKQYNQKNDPEYLNQLQQQFPHAHIIPEGGYNKAGIRGAASIAAYIPKDTDIVVVPVGTGTTLAGLRNGLAPSVSLIGFPVMKGGDYLYQEIKEQILSESGAWQLNCDYHFGGFARHVPELIRFMNQFYHEHHIPLDFVYTGKMMCGLLDMINNNKFASGSHIVCIHTGGLQGNQSIAHLLKYPY